MFLLLTFSLSLTGQYSGSPPFKPLPTEIKDLAFAHTQEEWVYQCNPHKIVDWHSVVKQDDADLMEIIDADKMSYRRFGRKRLREMGRAGLAISVWGSHAKSKELSLVCAGNLYNLYRCTFCDGIGSLTAIRNGFKYITPCDEGCKRSGNFLWYEKYNYDTGNMDFVERDLSK